MPLHFLRLDGTADGWTTATVQGLMRPAPFFVNRTSRKAEKYQSPLVLTTRGTHSNRPHPPVRKPAAFEAQNQLSFRSEILEGSLILTRCGIIIYRCTALLNIRTGQGPEKP